MIIINQKDAGMNLCMVFYAFGVNRFEKKKNFFHMVFLLNILATRVKKLASRANMLANNKIKKFPYSLSP